MPKQSSTSKDLDESCLTMWHHKLGEKELNFSTAARISNNEMDLKYANNAITQMISTGL